MGAASTAKRMDFCSYIEQGAGTGLLASAQLRCRRHQQSAAATHWSAAGLPPSCRPPPTECRSFGAQPPLVCRRRVCAVRSGCAGLSVQRAVCGAAVAQAAPAPPAAGALCVRLSSHGSSHPPVEFLGGRHATERTQHCGQPDEHPSRTASCGLPGHCRLPTLPGRHCQRAGAVTRSLCGVPWRVCAAHLLLQLPHGCMGQGRLIHARLTRL